MKKVIRLTAVLLIIVSATVSCSVKEKCPAYGQVSQESVENTLG